MIIGICGFAGSGKDTVADYLTQEHGFYKTSFASILKEAARLVFKFTDAQLYGPSSERNREDRRYPFTGICPRCHRQCANLHTIVFEGKPNPRSIGMHWACADCDEYYPKYITARLALQTLGTEWGRTLYSDIWVDATLNHIKRHQKEHKKRNWVISDVRFRNEVEAIQGCSDGAVLRLLRGEQLFTHASEAELATIDLDEFDHVIDNHGTLADLYEALEHALPKFHRLAGNA